MLQWDLCFQQSLFSPLCDVSELFSPVPEQVATSTQYLKRVFRAIMLLTVLAVRISQITETTWACVLCFDQPNKQLHHAALYRNAQTQTPIFARFTIRHRWGERVDRFFGLLISAVWKMSRSGAPPRRSLPSAREPSAPLAPPPLQLSAAGHWTLKSCHLFEIATFSKWHSLFSGVHSALAHHFSFTVFVPLMYHRSVIVFLWMICKVTLSVLGDAFSFTVLFPCYVC